MNPAAILGCRQCSYLQNLPTPASSSSEATKQLSQNRRGWTDRPHESVPFRRGGGGHRCLNADMKLTAALADFLGRLGYADRREISNEMWCMPMDHDLVPPYGNGLPCSTTQYGWIHSCDVAT